MARFFIEDLVPSLLGSAADDVAARARRFLSSPVLAHADAIRAAFHRDSGPVKHVALSDVLKAGQAEKVRRELQAARFRPHHYAPYRIDITPLEDLPRGALKSLCAWLGTDDAARFHGWLTGWPPKKSLVARQVQVARARKGDEFPVHVDMDEEGLAAVYNFSEPFGPDDGGTLYFPNPRGEGDLLRHPPVFNSLILFRPKDAPHGVSRIAGPNTRFSVTAFFVAAPPLPVGRGSG
ncbi:MAG: 2OG-Fe(II) oxygenase [Myxococcaceae bacterium]